ncbi:MAG: von Willebrand factor type A domain protein [Elusimicrobia bacterium ADurb.Bin231]|nr:MAG: von Willebrand factor type A domain protein [Elusimicrobia bacterium ADurb.Bin231]
MRFCYPYFLVLIPLFVTAYFLLVKNRKLKRRGIIISDIKIISGSDSAPAGIKFLSRIRILAVLLMILSLARPQGGEKSSEITKKGIDIILCLDTSTSMLAEDFKPHNRLVVAKQAVKKFVKGRKTDRIGVVVFSAAAFTQCPLTTDYGSLLDFIDKVEIGMTQTDGTAIGTALLTAVGRLKDSVSKSKVIILLTDGRNNAGEVDPVTAAKAAAAFGIKVYSIGAAGIGPAPYPVDDPVFGRRYVQMKEDLDEQTLSGISLATGGMFFRATDKASLEEIYKKIDALEKTDFKIDEYTNYRELYRYFLFPAALLFLLEIILSNTIFRTVP